MILIISLLWPNIQEMSKSSLGENTSILEETIFPIKCGKCPKGYYGDGILCKPRCIRLRCKMETEYCSAPDTCTRKYKTFF